MLVLHHRGACRHVGILEDVVVVRDRTARDPRRSQLFEPEGTLPCHGGVFGLGAPVSEVLPARRIIRQTGVVCAISSLPRTRQRVGHVRGQIRQR